RLFLQVLDWTRDEEENWDSDQEKVITDCFHIGEGTLYEGWDQDAEQGLGRPISRWVDSRYVLWDPAATVGFQRDDAKYMIWLERMLVADAELLYPALEGAIEAETIETFMQPHLQGHYRHRTAAARLSGMMGAPNEEGDFVWLRRQWEKKKVYKKVYFHKADGTAALVIRGEDGEQEALTEELYCCLTSEEQDQLYVAQKMTEEMWETVVVNNRVAENHISAFCKTRRGHGHFPFCFFSNVHLSDESHARGEIGFLVGAQDITNETVSMFLDQLFTSNVGYWQVFKGSLEPQEREKLADIGRKPNTVIETTLGVAPPQHMGTDSSGMAAAASAIPIIKDLADRISGINDPARGERGNRAESGRAIRALQAQTSQLATKVRRHIESGLRRATKLRMHNIMQFMRGNRVLEVTDPNTNAVKPLYMGHSEAEIMAFYNLRPEADDEAKEIKIVNEDGQEVEILVLNDDVAHEMMVERIELTLDTGQEKNKLERMDQAEMVLSTVGPPAIPWVAEQLDWTNKDQLIADIEKNNQAQQAFGQLEQM
ncbi:hypothetical protein LCGC14_2382710, partial [marine sediment metagenome]